MNSRGEKGNRSRWVFGAKADRHTMGPAPSLSFPIGERSPRPRAMDMSLSELRELVMDREAWRGTIHGVACSGPYWTPTKIIKVSRERAVWPQHGLASHSGSG